MVDEHGEEIVGILEAQMVLGLSDSMLRRLIGDGRLPAERRGRWRIASGSVTSKSWIGLRVIQRPTTWRKGRAARAAVDAGRAVECTGNCAVPWSRRHIVSSPFMTWRPGAVGRFGDGLRIGGYRSGMPARVSFGAGATPARGASSPGTIKSYGPIFKTRRNSCQKHDICFECKL